MSLSLTNSSSNAAASASSPSGSNGKSSLVSSVLRSIRRPFSAVYSFSSRLVSRAAPYFSLALDYAWFAGSTALLLTLPLLIEVQRETSVLILQKQREQEIAMIQEQAKLQNGGMLEQVKAMANMAAGRPPGGAPQ
jgi:hypothetical protein